LYLTEEEWDARKKKRETENHSDSDARGNDAGKGHGHNSSSSDGSSSGRPTGDECQRYGKLGHWARECRSKPKKE
jgi:hypothetical protein